MIRRPQASINEARSTPTHETIVWSVWWLRMPGTAGLLRDGNENRRGQPATETEPETENADHKLNFLSATWLFPIINCNQLVPLIARPLRIAEHHGYVTTQDVRELGIDPTQLRLMAARGRIERVGRGVYRVPVLPRGEHDELAAAIAWSRGRGVVSHESALRLHGLGDVNPSRIELSVRRDNHPRAAGGDLYRTHRRELAASEVTQVDTLPVTTVERTIRDCMATGTDPYQLRRAIEQAEAGGILRRKVARELRAEVDVAGAKASTWSKKVSV